MVGGDRRGGRAVCEGGQEMSAKRHPQSLKPARSVAEVSDPTVIPVDFPPGADEAVAETREYYNYLRQRAAETPLQIRMLSRATTLSTDEKKRWSEHGEGKRSNLIAMINTLISDLESVVTIDSPKKLSIVRGVWSIMQIELDDASCAIKLERIATTADNNKNRAKVARDGKAALDKYHITKRRVDEQREIDPELSNTKIARAIRQDLNADLARSGVSIFRADETLAKFVGKIFGNDTSKGRRKFQRQRN
jgi:hypothetical protein